MDQLKQTIQKLIELIGFNDFSVNFEEENKKVSIFINDGDWLKEWLPKLVSDFTQITRALSRKFNLDTVYIDINNYRRERENIITDLAKAAARRAIMSKIKVELPAMNAYERRLIHVELASRPDVATSSEGEGVERHVVVNPLEL